MITIGKHTNKTSKSYHNCEIITFLVHSVNSSGGA